MLSKDKAIILVLVLIVVFFGVVFLSGYLYSVSTKKEDGSYHTKKENLESGRNFVIGGVFATICIVALYFAIFRSRDAE